MNASAQIQADCAARGVSRLVHFTRSRKLPHILSESGGIRPAIDLETHAPDTLDANDPIRLDRRRDCVNCSVEYPNSWMMKKVRQHDPLFKDWAVLFVKPQYLWHPGTTFSQCNAAAAAARHDQGLGGLRALFEETVIGGAGRTFSRPTTMLPCCPTDDQAEVLVPCMIVSADIIAIAVPSPDQARRELARLNFVPGVRAVSFLIAPDLFNSTWSNKVRNGQRPKEGLFEG